MPCAQLLLFIVSLCEYSSFLSWLLCIYIFLSYILYVCSCFLVMHAAVQPISLDYFTFIAPFSRMLSQYFFRFRDLSHLPALLLWGTDDNIIEPRCSKVQFAHLRHPHSYGYWLHNASHALNFDTLPEVYTLTSAFLDDCNHGTNVSGNECSGKQAKGGWFAEALLAALPSRHVVRMLPEVDNDAGDNNHMKHERRLPRSRL